MLNFVRPFLASTIRVNSIALGLTKWFVFLQSFSRLGIARILFASALGSGKTSVFDAVPLFPARYAAVRFGPTKTAFEQRYD